MNTPKVSLVLTTYNSKELLPMTLDSILEQDYPNIEIVIKDGESTDGTIDIIKKFEQIINESVESDKAKGEAGQLGLSLIWTSCHDTGIYDAMNQGITLSTGDIIACFNDRFTCPDAVSKYVRALENYKAVHSDLNYVDYTADDKVVRTWHMGRGKISQGWMPGHPTLFVRREVYERYSLKDERDSQSANSTYYKTDYRISADYEFIVRILKDGTTTLNYIPETLIKMYYGGTSSSSLLSYIQSFMEGWRALRENKVKCGLWITIRRTIRVLKQF